MSALTAAELDVQRLSDAIEVVMDEIGWDHDVLRSRLGAPEADALVNLRAVYEAVHGLAVVQPATEETT